MRIGIEVNNVLRDTLRKIQQEYEKWYLSPFFENKEFDYGIISDLDSLDIMSHLKFINEEELYEFLYQEHAMEIFGHSGSVETFTMNDLNDFYLEFRDNHDIVIVSDEIGKSKPATLFFLSKFGCLVETIKFYSEPTINSMWDSIDVLLTSNPNLLLTKPPKKIVIKYARKFNEGIEADFEITTIKQFKEKIIEILC